MDQGFVIQRKSNPRQNANIFSRLFFIYIYPLYVQGHKKELEEHDMYNIIEDFSSQKLGDDLEKCWEKERKRHKTPSILRAIFACFGKQYFYLFLIQLIVKIFLIILTPLAMGKFVLYFTPNQTELSRIEAIFYAILVIVVDMIKCIYDHNYILAKAELVIKIQAAVCSLIYRKCLRLNTSALISKNTGKVVTMISKDIGNIDYAVHFGNDFLVEFLQAGIILYLFYLKVGVAAFVSYSLFFAILPMQLIIAKIIYNKRKITNQKADERLQITQEFLSAVKIIKMYAWERYFTKKVTEARRKEMVKLRGILLLKEFTFCIGALCIKLSFYILALTYMALGNTLTPEIVYYVKSCYQKLKRTIVYIMPLATNQSAELIASFRRIDKLLNAEEYEPNLNKNSLTILPRICFKKVNVYLQETLLLKDIDMLLKSGLHIVIGPVGSGKSSLLKAILHEFTVTRGKIEIDGSISYACQNPWLFPSSIRQNILFGQKQDEERYQKVIKICALNQDLENLTKGDKTIIGDCGINLSKGQQARINLARALYKKSDIYLLDDCLSSLDAHVRSYIFRHAVKSFLKNKLVILISHNSALLKESDNVIFMEKGEVKFSGKPDQIIDQNLLESYRAPLVPRRLSLTADDVDFMKDEEIVDSCPPSSPNIYHEVKKTGRVNWKIYTKYFKFGGLCLWILSIFLCICDEATSGYAEKLVSQWMNIEANLTSLKKDNLTNSTKYAELFKEGSKNFTYYSVLIVVSTATFLMASTVQYIYSSRLSINLHKFMVVNIFSATMKFFDTHLIGNVLNRFSKDLYVIDEYMSYAINEGVKIVLTLIGSIILISTVNLEFMTFSISLILLFAYICNFYLATGRSLQRLDGATRSPVVGHLNATLEGLITIRAYNTEELLKQEFDRHQDLHTSTRHLMKMSSRGLGFLLSFICSIFVAFVVGRFLFIKTDEAGNVGLAISQVIMLSGFLGWGLRQWVEVETHMTGVERALEYTLAEKEATEVESKETSFIKGCVIFDNVNLTYRADTEQVLKNVSFIINSGEKIGIVGRTGAGKSSIILALFRLYEIEGTISIDGVDIKSLPLSELRRNISIIPQDPILFTGTIRDNIDPCLRYKDHELWYALDAVNLTSSIKNLNEDISKVGNNFSVGQKQLICLARAIVCKAKIVVLDEATSNMDEEMDRFVHTKIQELFKLCTIITVAHRLHSVLDSDKVMVMDRGQIIEFDKPSILLANKESVFYRMVQKANITTIR